ncbi:uncharacterized protein PRCAT00005242001 [Priceomyces carsonii]|uniref:uncharacterized protein n=1 Tax=Priceomyces carsonii TaxID=28549 RepID=UPI002ED807BF|nr:unnamed protein product [Priceomyces carsonii]
MLRNVMISNLSLKVYSSVLFSRRFYHAIGSGPHGIEGRLPGNRTKIDEGENSNNQVAITDPFVLYQNYVSQGLLEKDEQQLRAMKEFQKLYYRVVDYIPPEELLIKMSLLLRKIELKQAESTLRGSDSDVPTFRLVSVRRIFGKDPELEKRQLVRYINDDEELQNFASPMGLLVNGEVGCGKSLLMDIFATSLPHKSKMRWHYNNFILWVYTEMHKIQQERILTANLNITTGRDKMTMENEFILFEIAQKMINRSTILMLDEFMLPDIASANIVKILFTYFFKLGGVLVATSNKLPEELYSNAFNKTKFKDFIGILHARCQSIDMRSTRDYRTLAASASSNEPFSVVKLDNPDHEKQWSTLVKTRALAYPPDSEIVKVDVPLKLLGKPSSFTVYNRTTHVPLTFNDSVCYLDYSFICQGLFSSSDYISLASIFNTIVVDNVPIMTMKMKNEARRFITLLDAIYEAKCQFFMRSEVAVDDLFFPDALSSKNPSVLKILQERQDKMGTLDVQDEEMYAKTTMDISNPYRPNVSSYDENSTFSDIKSTKNGTSNGNKEDNNPKDPVDFKDTRAFTGEDEKFAYKRAVSRIKEMTRSENWRLKAQWVPIDESMRPWESSYSPGLLKGAPYTKRNETVLDRDIDNLINENKSLDKIAKQILTNTNAREYSKSKGIPLATLNVALAPIFNSLNHFWKMGSWTNKQGKRLRDSILKSWIRSSIRDDDDK